MRSRTSRIITFWVTFISICTQDQINTIMLLLLLSPKEPRLMVKFYQLPLQWSLTLIHQQRISHHCFNTAKLSLSSMNSAMSCTTCALKLTIADFPAPLSREISLKCQVKCLKTGSGIKTSLKRFPSTTRLENLFLMTSLTRRLPVRTPTSPQRPLIRSSTEPLISFYIQLPTRSFLTIPKTSPDRPLAIHKL